MNDTISRDALKPFKWVGTRQVRPDGVPKVTGRAQYGSDQTMPGMLIGLAKARAAIKERAGEPPRPAARRRRRERRG